MVSGNPAGIYPQSFYGNIGSVFVPGLPAYGFDKMCHRICVVEERYVDSEYCKYGSVRLSQYRKIRLAKQNMKWYAFDKHIFFDYHLAYANSLGVILSDFMEIYANTH